MRRLIFSKVTTDWRAGSKKFGSPVRREGQSPTLSLPLSMQRGPVPEGRSKSLSVPQIFVVETELMPLQKRLVHLFNRPARCHGLSGCRICGNLTYEILHIEGGTRRQCSRTKEQPQIDESKANPCGM